MKGNIQMIFILPEIQDRYGFGVNNVAALLLVLSKDGTQSIFYSEAQIAKKAHCSKRLVTKTKQILNQDGYITLTTLLNERNEKYTKIDVLEKLVNAKYFNDQSNENTYSTECYTPIAQQAIPTAQNATGYSTECYKVSHNVLDGIAQNANKKEVIKEVIKEDLNKFIGNDDEKISDKKWNEFKNEVLLKNEADLENGSLKEKGEPTVLDATATASAVAPKKKSSAKRERVITKAPQSIEETEELVRRFQKQNADVPNMDKLDVRGYAREIFSYYGAPYDDGKWRDGKGTIIKVPMRSVSGWINRDYKRNGKYKLQEGMEDVNPECEALFEKYQKLADQNKQNSNEPVETQFEFVNNIKTPTELPNMDYETMFLPRAKEN